MPVYPEFARSTGISGMVRVEIVIDENGKVTSAHALSGPAQLHQAAVKAALRAKFSPAMRAGKPVKITAVIGYNFVPAS
jgi:protein TonB